MEHTNLRASAWRWGNQTGRSQILSLFALESNSLGENAVLPGYKYNQQQGHVLIRGNPIPRLLLSSSPSWHSPSPFPF